MKLVLLSTLLSCVAALPATGDGPEALEGRQTCSLTPTNPSTFWYEHHPQWHLPLHPQRRQLARLPQCQDQLRCQG